MITFHMLSFTTCFLSSHDHLKKCGWNFCFTVALERMLEVFSEKKHLHVWQVMFMFLFSLNLKNFFFFNLWVYGWLCLSVGSNCLWPSLYYSIVKDSWFFFSLVFHWRGLCIHCYTLTVDFCWQFAVLIVWIIKLVAQRHILFSFCLS